MRIVLPLPMARHAACAVLAVAHLVASLGLPVPTASSGSHACQQQACGCSTERVLSGACCCSGQTAIKSCCSPKPAIKSCCSTQSADCCEDDAVPPVKWVLAWQAARCRGQGPGGLIVTPPAIPPVPPVTMTWLPEPGEPVLAIVAHPVSVPFRPPVPPPRFV